VRGECLGFHKHSHIYSTKPRMSRFGDQIMIWASRSLRSQSHGHLYETFEGTRSRHCHSVCASGEGLGLQKSPVYTQRRFTCNVLDFDIFVV